MKVFNAIQITALMACAPFVIGWLAKGPFPYSTAIMWASALGYFAGLVFQTAATHHIMSE